MIFALVALTVVALAQGYIIRTLIIEGRTERQALEDRLLELIEPGAVKRVLSAHDSPSKARVTYMDERREYEVQHGTPPS